MSQNKKTDTACSQATQAQTMPHRLLSARHVRGFGVFRGVSVGAAVHVTARNLMRAVVRTAAAIASPAAARAGLAAVFGALAIVASPPAQAAESGATPRPAHGLIVKLKDAPAHAAAMERRQDNGRLRGDVERERMQRVMGQAGVAALKTRPSGRASQLLDFGRVLSGREAEQLAAQLRLRPEVEWVVPNERERRLQSTTNVPNDPYYPASFFADPGQWWLYANGSANSQAIPGFQSVWSRGYLGTPSAVVAVLDTGITAHPDLDGTMLQGYDFVDGDSNPTDPGDFCGDDPSSWHGTAIAGMLAALTNNGGGVAAISWDGRVLPVRVAGNCGAFIADIIDGMYWVAGFAVGDAPAAQPGTVRARVVNISFGGSEPCNSAYRAAIADLAEAGVVVVAAAGNEKGTVTRPASCPGVVAVAALNRDGMKASYSNFGSAVTIATVGGDFGPDTVPSPAYDDGGLLSTHNTGATTLVGFRYSYLEGTSFAAPIVAGTVSLMLSVNPNLTVAQIIDGLRSTARPHITSSTINSCSIDNPSRCECTTSTCGSGVLDAEQAVLYATNPRADAGDSNSGGGALGFGWLLALGAAVAALARRRVVGGSC